MPPSLQLLYCLFQLTFSHFIPFSDSKGNPRSTTNSKGRKRRPGTKELSSALKTNDPLFLDFLRRCLEWDPVNRITPEGALQHDWIMEVRRKVQGFILREREVIFEGVVLGRGRELVFSGGRGLVFGGRMG